MAMRGGPDAAWCAAAAAASYRRTFSMVISRRLPQQNRDSVAGAFVKAIGHIQDGKSAIRAVYAKR